jgi:Chalcone isomerase-like
MLLLLTALLTTPAAVAIADTGHTISGVTMPATIEVDGNTLSLNGMALRKKVIFKVYVAALYVSTTSSHADEILGADAPRRMVMHFVRNVGKEKICEGWDEGLEKNTPSASATLKAQFTELCGLMADIKDGERFVFTYVPDKGTTVEVAGVEKGTIAGKEFADAMLACWIGPKPGPGDGFKKDLLGA